MQSAASFDCISSMTHKFSCMFDKCEREFQTLRQFKLHITEDHQQEEPANDVETGAEQEDEDNQGHHIDGEGAAKTKAKAGNAKHLAMDAAEKSALNGLLKLCELTKPEEETSIVAGKPKVLKITQLSCDTINNITVIPLLSPSNSNTARKVRSPKNRKFPLQAAIVLGENESSAKFYENAKQVTTQNESPRGFISNIKMSNIAEPKHAQNTQNKVSGKKRKISEMNSDQLAHLCLKLQDKIKTLDAQLKLSQRQLVTVKNVYRKKAKKRTK